MKRLTLIFMALLGALPLAADTKPHIILVMADDQGWGDVGYNGHPFVETPALDAMAAQAFVFDRFYSAAPVCSPTRAAALTGRHPIRTKVPNHGRYMREKEITIAEVLKAHGYVTGIFGKLHLGSGQPGSPANPSAMGFDQWVIGLNFFDNDPYLSHNGVVRRRLGKGSVILMDDTIAFLEKHQASEKPIFAIAWFPSPHDPHREVPDGPELYAGKPLAGYYREITLLDRQLGRLRRALKRLGIAHNTILWYTSDNGGLNKQTSGGRMKKGSIYEGGLRVPTIVEWPEGKLKGRSSVPVNTCDIFPTLLALAGIQHESPHLLDGADMSGLFAGTLSRRPSPMGFWHRFQGGQATWSDRILKAIMEKQLAGAPTPHDAPRLKKDIEEYPQFPLDTVRGHAAWTDWPWKLHRISAKKTLKFELYDLETDPMETRNLADLPEQQERLESMKRDLKNWSHSVIHSINGKDYDL